MYSYFAQTAFVTIFAVFLLVEGTGKTTGSQEHHDQNDSEEKDVLDEDHSYVALLDIVFTDNSKRTCTGAIVHDNIVITAAHCFQSIDKSTESQPELTASFVVIGTKKMFDSGYEQYLPIERIVVHPKYEGWTADLALVFTFAGMTSDKPGTVISLAGEKKTTHVDNNLTVFSWGHPRKTQQVSTVNTLHTKPDKSNSNENDEDEDASEESCDSSQESRKNKYTHAKKDMRTAGPKKRFRNDEIKYTKQHQNKKKRILRKNTLFRYKSQIERAREGVRREILHNTRKSTMSRYLTNMGSVENARIDSSINPYVFGHDETYESIEKLLRTRSITKTTLNTHLIKKKTYTQQVPVTLNKAGHKKKQPVKFRLRSGVHWRRNMGSQHNRLLVETFGHVSLQQCKTIVDKALPSVFNISKHNDVICYTNDERCVSDDDSGAPAVRQGQLVAITLGGAECDGDNVAVGMKMACYCSWISDNLPRGSSSFTCCKNCCDVNHKEEKKRDRRHRFKNRYI